MQQVSAKDDIRSFKDLKVWQKAVGLSVDRYRLTARFPQSEAFGMTAQIRRASVSVAANIAEGHGREQTKPSIQFLRAAQGSAKELETHLVIVEAVGLASHSEIEPLFAAIDEVGRMTRSLIRSLEAKVGSVA